MLSIKTPKILEDQYVILQDGDIAILAIGGMVEPAVKAGILFKEMFGRDIRVICVTALKSLNTKKLLKSLDGVKGIVTAEDHNINAGFGSVIAEALAKEKPLPMEMIGLPDIFGCSDSSANLKLHYGLTTKQIIKAIQKLQNRIQE